MLFLKGKLCKLKRRLFFVIPVTCFIVSSVETISAGEKLLSAGQKSEIQDLIRQYILKNPDEILESIQKLHARKEREREERSQKNLIVMEPQLTKEPTSPVGGNLNGDVTIVEFFDYRCGYCKTIVPTIQKVLETDPKVRLVFKEFPILGPSSELAARAGLAVWRLEPAKYERFHFTLMQTRGQLPEAEIMTIASKLGINPKKLSQEMKGPYVKKAIEKNIALAKSLDIRGTPNFIIGNELVRGAIDFSTIKRLIAKARKG